MSADLDRQRTRKARIARLADRLRDAKTWPQIQGIVKGILDLLADEA